MDFNAGIISIVFIALFAAITLFRKHGGDAKEAYACGERGDNWGAGAEDTLYARLYKTLGLGKLDRMHKDDLNEYVSWMFIAIIAAFAVFTLLGA